MVVAVLKGQENLSQKITCRIAKKIKLHTTSSNFCFETLDAKPVENFSNFWHDLSYCGRHYLINASTEPSLSRQYTVCNTFIPEFYEAIFKLCESVLMDETPKFDMN